MNFFNCAHTDEIFSYLDDATGEQLHFNVTKMFDWCSAEARKLGPNEENSEFEMIRTPFDPHHVKHVILRKNIDYNRVDQLGEPCLSKPLLAVVMPDGMPCLVDGHHRLVRLYADGAEEYTFYLVKLGHWERFLVDIAIFNIKEYLGVSQYPEMGACI